MQLAKPFCVHGWGRGLVIFFSFWILFPLQSKAQTDNLYIKMQIFNLILNEVQKHYVDPVEPTELMEDAIKGMLTNLDPHTTYLPREQFEVWQKGFEGFAGIGIYYHLIDKAITVMSVIENGPADRAGMMPNDQILAINGWPTLNLKPEEIPNRLQGAHGTSVTLTIQRAGWKKNRDFSVIREHILVQSVSDAYLLQTRIGYVKITKFTATTGDELFHKLKQLEQQGMQHLILDLRDNGGGLMQAAIDVVDLFLPDKRKIVFKQGRTQSSYEEYWSSGHAPFPNLPLIILMNHASASASEIVAGAVQDWDRGLIIGETSFGKGLVQSQIRFADNSALLITTARYFTPCGRSIQRDYHFKSKDQYYAEAYPDSSNSTEVVPNQAQVYYTLQGRPIYAGGGITPDIVIPGAIHSVSPELKQIYYFSRTSHSIFELLVDNYIHQNEFGFNLRQARDSTQVEIFIDRFRMTPALITQFKKAVAAADYEFTAEQIQKNLTALQFIIMREIAFRLWGKYGRFRIQATQDQQMRGAIEHFPAAQQLIDASRVMYQQIAK
ncbi:S41 family peptidase [candidate division KSB1 bacterium]|nr:S41 family peptidase [candidate division KSB1 bacterium]